MIDLQDIIGFFRDSGVGNLLLLLIVVTPLLAGLYKRLFLSPKLMVSLAPAVTGTRPRAGGEPPVQQFKSQALLLTSKRGPIHNCKAKAVWGKESLYMSWDTTRDNWGGTDMGTLTRDLLPEEEVRLPVWEAIKTSEGEWFSLNIGPVNMIDMKNKTGTITLEIWLLSEEGVLSKKPYRYAISGNSWDNISMVSVGH